MEYFNLMMSSKARCWMGIYFVIMKILEKNASRVHGETLVYGHSRVTILSANNIKLIVALTDRIMQLNDSGKSYDPWTLLCLPLVSVILWYRFHFLCHSFTMRICCPLPSVKSKYNSVLVYPIEMRGFLQVNFPRVLVGLSIEGNASS